MSLAVGFVVLLLLAATGAWPAMRWGRHVAGVGWIGRLSLSLTLGAAITGLVQLTLSLLGVPSGLGVPAALAILSLVGCRMAPGAPRGSAAPGDARGGSAEDGSSAEAGDVKAGDAIAGDANRTDANRTDANRTGAEASRGTPGLPLTAWLLLVVLVSTVVAVGLPFSGDGSKFWAPKARDLAEHSALTAPSIVDETRLGFHRGYPLLVPALMAPAFGHSPPDGSAGAKLVLHGLLLAMLGLATTLLSACGSNGHWLAAALLAMPALVVPAARESLSAGGYVDGADALFLLLLVDTVDRLRRGAAQGGDAWLAALAAAALVSTKLEGAVELTIVLCAWLLAGPIRGLPLGRLLVVGGVLSIPTIWLAALAPGDPSISNPALLLQGGVLWGRALPVAAALGGLLIDTSSLGLAPLAILACALAGRPRWGFGLLLLLGCLAFLSLVYMSTTMHVGRHLYTSVHRLTLHWLPAFALLAGRSLARSAARSPDNGR